jgi:hypothetical protein
MIKSQAHEPGWIEWFDGWLLEHNASDPSKDSGYAKKTTKYQ